MKKKTLIVLLMIPFIVGLLSFVSYILLNITTVASITINWDYRSQEGFRVREEPYLLEATATVQSDNLVAPDDMSLTWTINGDESVAYLTSTSDGEYYLHAVSEGTVEIVCSPTSAKGDSKMFTAIIYETGAIIINPVLSSTGNEIESTRYYGEYDITYSEATKGGEISKNNAVIDLDIEVLGDDISSGYKATGSSEYVSFSNDQITIHNIDSEEELLTGYVTFGINDAVHTSISNTYYFYIVNDGINIYSYKDLLMCTNYSDEGEIVVMQTSLGSLRDVYVGHDEEIGENSNQNAYKYVVDLPLTRLDESANIDLFGTYDETTNSFNFENEIYYTESTYNTKFLDDWNEDNPSNQVSTEIKVGIRVQKDFYGNGFSINMNNLCFPNNGYISTYSSKLIPGDGDLFTGPLALVTIGDPTSELIVIKAFGQDNAGIMLDGDGITLNGLNVSNIDDNSNKRNYAYVGTVVEVNGNNNTIKNCIIRRGKTLVRAFDADNFLLDNSILSTSGEFSLKVGSNQIYSPDESQTIEYEFSGYTFSFDFEDFFDLNSTSTISANTIYNEYLGVSNTLGLSNDELYEVLRAMQGYFNNTSEIINDDGSINYVAEMTVNDTSFEDSGIFSVALDTSFNGPYLYNGMSNYIHSMLSIFSDWMFPDTVGGTSMPVYLNISGNTKFYDWKDVNDVDITNLIDENIATVMGSFLGVSDVTIDDFFPLKSILVDDADDAGYLYSYNESEYVNTAIAYYGGGLNLSTIDTSNLNSDMSSWLGDELVVDLLSEIDDYIDSSSSAIKLLSRCVLFAAGFEPFKFVVNSEIGDDTPYLFGESASINELRQNLQK